MTHHYNRAATSRAVAAAQGSLQLESCPWFKSQHTAPVADSTSGECAGVLFLFLARCRLELEIDQLHFQELGVARREYQMKGAVNV